MEAAAAARKLQAAAASIHDRNQELHLHKQNVSCKAATDSVSWLVLRMEMQDL